MNIMEQILSEIYHPVKNFNSEEELLLALRRILRKASFPKYTERKSGSGKGFGAPTQFGYKFKGIHGNYLISFFGHEALWISELARALKAAKINYHYNDKQNIFSIKSFDNLKPEALLSPEATEELEFGAYDIIDLVVKDKTSIKPLLAGFNRTQRRVYDELIDNGLIEWRLNRAGKSDSPKISYILVKTTK